MDPEEPNSDIQTDFIVNPDGSITADDITIPAPPAPALTCEALTERLIITELVLRNFKSYAGTHVLGPFNKNFTCIVGPNGSGKSNVIDALLFVFGYKSQKIRSKKVSVLIHNSDKFSDLKSCSVAVKFANIQDEGSNFTVVPGSEFCVKRTGYSDNTSVYEINGKRAQYRDVANLLRGHNVDLDYNRFMILQGEIELISMMKPKAVSEQESGMLEYIEDIIGSNRFIKPIQHFNSKVEQMNEKRLEELNLLKVIEKERADAEKPKNKAMEYLKLANKVTLLRNSVFQVQLKEAADEGEKIKESKNALTEQIDAIAVASETLEASKDLKERELKNVLNNYENCSKTVEELKQEFAGLERQDVACRENIKNEKEKFKKLVKTLDAEEVKVTSLEKQQSTFLNETAELEEKKKRLEAAKAIEDQKLTEVMGSMKNEIKDFQEEKDVHESELVQLKSTVNEKKSEVDLLQSELNLHLNAEEKARETLHSLKLDHENCISSIQEEKKAINEAEKKIPELEQTLSTSQKQLYEAEEKETLLTEELKNKRIKLDEVKSSFTASQNRNALVQAFMGQKAKGKLTGVYGRLGDLGAIDEKYDVAISTACGSLDHIVTDTIDTAQECVKFLKASNLGYATFIPLDKMKQWEPYAEKKITTPEGVPRLFDLISVKNKDVLPAFFFALKNTLVADNLEQATRVGLQGTERYRVVTLKGELIDLSGTMSGGGGRVLKGRMGRSVLDSSSSQKEVEILTSELDKLTKDIAEIKKHKLELKETIQEVQKEISGLQHSVKKAKMNYDGYVEREKVLVSQIEAQKKQLVSAAPDKMKVKELKAKIEKREKNYSEAVNAASVVEEKVKELQDKIMSITKGKVGAAQKKIDKLTKDISEVAQHILKSTGNFKKSEKNLKKSKEKIISLESEIESLRVSREKLKAELTSLEEKGLEIRKKKEAAMSKLEECESQKKLISKEVQDLSSELHKMKSELIECKNKVKMMDIEIKTNQGLINSIKGKLANLELYETEEGSTELPTFTPEEIEEISASKLSYEVGILENEMKNMKPDLKAIAEYKRKDEMYRNKKQELDNVIMQKEHYKQHYEKLRRHRFDEFMKGFNIVSLKVKELYQMITLGGDAELELVDSLDPFSEGVEFSVRPVRKSWKNIRNLSGGEKTLSSLSLVFALHYYRSTPFFVMDEIDAALDFRNVSIIASYIKESTKNAQFIVISLREYMFEKADHLLGIYKTYNNTKNVVFSPALLKGSSDSKVEEDNGEKLDSIVGNITCDDVFANTFSAEKDNSEEKRLSKKRKIDLVESAQDVEDKENTAFDNLLRKSSSKDKVKHLKSSDTAHKMKSPLTEGDARE